MENTLRCAISSCHSNNEESAENTETVLYFPFPENPARCAQWLKASGLEETFGDKFDSQFISENYALCGRHFDESSFFSGIENCLLEDAVPTLFLRNTEEAPDDAIQPQYIYVQSSEPEILENSSQIYYLQLIDDQSNAISHDMQVAALNGEFISGDVYSQSTDEIHLLSEIQMCSDLIPAGAMMETEMANQLHVRAVENISELAQMGREESDVAEAQSSFSPKEEGSTVPGNILYSLLKDSSSKKKKTTKYGNGTKMNLKVQQELKMKRKRRQNQSKVAKSASLQNRPSGGILPKRTQREIELQKEVRKFQARISRLKEKLSKAEAGVEKVETEFSNFKSVNPVYPETVKKFADLFKPCRGGKGAKYCEDMKQFALTLDTISSKVYSFLSEFVPLPSKRLLQIMRAKGELGFTE